MYNKVVNSVLSLSKKFGGKITGEQKVTFFFYADTEDLGSNLAIELSRLGYDIYGVECSGNKWSVIGNTSAMKIDTKSLTNLGKSMYFLAEEMNVEFDGWEIEMKV
jgi:hypothetical protein